MKKFLALMFLLLAFSGCSTRDIHNGIIQDNVALTEVEASSINEVLLVDKDKDNDKEKDMDTTFNEDANLSTNKEVIDTLSSIIEELANAGRFSIDRFENKDHFDEIWENIEGKWYDSEYLNEIDIKKLNINDIRYMKVSSDGSNDEFDYQIVEFNLMDGWGVLVTRFEIDKEKECIDIYGKYLPTDEETLQYVFDYKKLQIKSAEGEKYFNYLSYDIADYMNEKLLVGEYVDSLGIEYSFSNDRIAKWGEKEFSYTPFLDTMWELDCLPITVLDKEANSTNELYGYSFKDDALLLYTIVSTNGTNELGEPIVLKRK